MYIKASRIAHLTDARYFAARHVDAIGFDLSLPNATSQFLALAEWVEGTLLVGDLGFGTAQNYQALIESLNLKAVQLPHFTDIATCRDIQSQVEQCFFAVSLQADDVEYRLSQINQLMRQQDMIVLEAQDHSFSDLMEDKTQVNFEHIQQLCSTYPVLLDIQFTQADLSQIQAELSLHGFQLQGSEEEAVGVKSFDDIDDILDDVKPLWE